MEKLYKIPYLENYLINKKGSVYNIKTNVDILIMEPLLKFGID